MTMTELCKPFIFIHAIYWDFWQLHKSGMPHRSWPPMAYCIAQWFLNGGYASPGGRQYISRGCEPLLALQHEKFDQ